jgi:hypothetical protein
MAAYALANRTTATSVASLQAQATIHGYHVAFECAAVFLVVGAVITGLLLRRGAMASLVNGGAPQRQVAGSGQVRRRDG